MKYSDLDRPVRDKHMLALRGMHGPMRRALILLLVVGVTASAVSCNSSKRKSDWRPDVMRSSDEWMTMALESTHPNERRRGVVGLAESRDGASDWALKVFDTVARSDTDPSVRCAALRAMEQVAEPQSQATAVALLQSGTKRVEDVIPAPAAVRWGAARVLYAVAIKRGDAAAESTAVVATLIEASHRDPDHRVRVTVLDTLGFYRERSVPPALVDALDDEDFAIRRAAESSLVALTGVTHRYDADAWRAWLAKTADPFANAGQTPDGWDHSEEKPKWDWLQLPGSG